MRDYLLFYVNGKEHRVDANSTFQPLSAYLRSDAGKTGTKVVCEEGDCGACTVLLGMAGTDESISYHPVNSCIQYLYQIDGMHVVTVEGLAADAAHPVQTAMAECHGTQCGFCTPGFVVTMCGLFDKQCAVSSKELKDALTGNLCRCTGYLPIIESGLSTSAASITPLNQLYSSASMREKLQHAQHDDVMLSDGNRSVYMPATLDSAVHYRAANPDAVILSGGTDVCVNMNKRNLYPLKILCLARCQRADQIKVEDGKAVIDAGVTLTQLEVFARDNHPELYKLLCLFGSPQIRNAATLAGNIANASPIADTLPLLYVMNAQVELIGRSGSRLVNINDFYTGYKQLVMRSDELIRRVHLFLPSQNEILKLYKVSKRKHLDISTFTAAFRLQLDTDTISSIAIAYGGVAPVVLKMRKTEEFLTGKAFSLANLMNAASIAASEIAPITDVRGRQEFRMQLAKNILSKFFYEVQESRRGAICLQ